MVQNCGLICLQPGLMGRLSLLRVANRCASHVFDFLGPLPDDDILGSYEQRNVICYHDGTAIMHMVPEEYSERIISSFKISLKRYKQIFQLHQYLIDSPLSCYKVQMVTISICNNSFCQ